MDNLLNDGKDFALSSLCLCTDKLSISKSTAIKSSRGLIAEVQVDVGEDKCNGKHREGIGEGKECVRAIEVNIA